MLEIGSADYVPTARLKKGEYEALGEFPEDLKDRMLPNIIVPPMSARDIEANRKLSRSEFSPTHVGRILKYWGRRPCLVDCRFVEFIPSRVSDAQRLLAFLTAGANFGCGFIPVVDLKTNEHRINAVRDYWLKTNHGLALRLSLSDIGRQKLETTVQNKLLKLVAKPTDCILLVDFSDADLSEEEEFANFVHDWLFRLQQVGNWRRIVVQATNYPVERNPASPNGSFTVCRTEWKIWESLCARESRVQEIAMFGDFGADNANFSFKGGGMPITHLRYALEKEWRIVRGGAPTKEGDGSIRHVSKRIVASDFFAGADFSAGDAQIAAWAAGGGLLGGASVWRKTNMSHHWTRTLVDLGALYGRRISLKPRPTEPVQQELFAALSSPNEK
jgi:Beta protein